MTLSPAAQAQIDADRQRRTAWLRGEAPLVDARLGSRALDLQLVEPGCSIWSHDHGPDSRRNANDEPRGGVVLEVVTARTVDTTTGELGEHRAFRAFDPYLAHTRPIGRAYVTLTEAQVNPDACEAPDMGLLRRVRRAMCRAVGERRTTTGTDELRLALDIARLATIEGALR